MQTKKDATAETQKILDKLSQFLLETRSVHVGRIEGSDPGDERFYLAFDLPRDCPFPISPEAFGHLWIQVTLEPHYAFLAVPYSWSVQTSTLIIHPRRDREDLDVYATVALESGGHPRIVKVGAFAKNVFRTFLISSPH